MRTTIFAFFPGTARVAMNWNPKQEASPRQADGTQRQTEAWIQAYRTGRLDELFHSGDAQVSASVLLRLASYTRAPIMRSGNAG
jgi:hypothetical protein